MTLTHFRLPRETPLRAAEAPLAPLASLGGAAAPVQRFAGHSLWAYIYAHRTQEQKLAALMNLGALKPTAASALTGLTTQLGLKVASDPLAKQSLDLEKLAEAPTPEAPDAPALSAAARQRSQAELRRRLEALQPRFSALYDDALRQDPTYKIRLLFTARVESGGRLSDIRFQSSGEAGAQHALTESLTSAIRSELARVKAPPELNGFSFRRELLFWR